MTQADGVLDEEITYQLFREHVSDLDEKAARRAAEGFRRVLAEMSASAQTAGAQTAQFDESLAKFGERVAGGSAPDTAAVSEIVAHTRQMREGMATLAARLESSQQEIERLRGEIDRARDEAWWMPSPAWPTAAPSSRGSPRRWPTPAHRTAW